MEQITLALGLILGKNIYQGAQTTLHLALASGQGGSTRDAINGKYFSDCREEKLIVSSQIGDKNIEKKLWEKTLEILKIQFRI
jgi:hypothetical protein